MVGLNWGSTELHRFIMNINWGWMYSSRCKRCVLHVRLIEINSWIINVLILLVNLLCADLRRGFSIIIQWSRTQLRVKGEKRAEYKISVTEHKLYLNIVSNNLFGQMLSPVQHLLCPHAVEMNYSFSSCLNCIMSKENYF